MECSEHTTWADCRSKRLMSHKSPVKCGQGLLPVTWGLFTGSRWAGPRGAWPRDADLQVPLRRAKPDCPRWDLETRDSERLKGECELWRGGAYRAERKRRSMEENYGGSQVRDGDRGGGG